MSGPGGIVFDLDGTLIDSAPDLLAITNTLLMDAGRRPLSSNEIVPMIGDGIPALVERAFAATGSGRSPGDADRLTSAFLEIYLDPGRVQLTRLYPDVLMTLARIRKCGFRLAVCTNKVEQAAVSVLDKLGFAGVFDAIVGGDTVPAKKPDPAHIRAALDRLGVPGALAVTVGDSRNDIAAGAAAGTAVIAVTYGYGDISTALPRPTLVIDRFRDLPGALQQILAGRATG